MANKSKKQTVLSKIYNPVSMNLGAVKGGWKGGNGQACTLVLLSLSEPEHWASWTTGLTKQNISYVLMMMPRTGQNLKIFQHGMTYCTDMLRPFFKNVLRDQHIPSQHKVHFCSSNAKGRKDSSRLLLLSVMCSINALSHILEHLYRCVQRLKGIIQAAGWELSSMYFYYKTL